MIAKFPSNLENESTDINREESYYIYVKLSLKTLMSQPIDLTVIDLYI